MQWLDKAVRTAKDHPSADADDTAGLIMHLDDLRIEQVLGGHKPWFRPVAHFPTTPVTIHYPSTWSSAAG